MCYFTRSHLFYPEKKSLQRLLNYKFQDIRPYAKVPRRLSNKRSEGKYLYLN